VFRDSSDGRSVCGIRGKLAADSEDIGHNPSRALQFGAHQIYEIGRGGPVPGVLVMDNKQPAGQH
jgi:hypothetical protein